MGLNKRALWRVVEASAAVLIVISVLLYLSYQQENAVKTDLLGQIPSVLNELAKNRSLREDILNDNDLTRDAENKIIEMMGNSIKEPSLEYNISICDALSGLPCGGAGFYPLDREIFSEERLISANIENYNPKIIKFFIWRRSN